MLGAFRKSDRHKVASSIRKQIMRFKEYLAEAQPFKRYGNHKGILTRTITPADKEAAEQREKERAKKRYASSKQAKLDDLRTEPLPKDIPWDELRDILDSQGPGLGGEIVDILDKRDTTIVKDGKTVAARKYSVYVGYNVDDFGYDEETIKQMGGREQEHISDAIKFTIYRDPADPKRFRGSL